MKRELIKKLLMYLIPAILGSGVTIAVSDALSIKCVPVVNSGDQNAQT